MYKIAPTSLYTMEKVGQDEQKKGKGKKAKPVKVVYISNPMRITTCPSKFRAVVQELTGQDADPDRADAGNYVVDSDGVAAPTVGPILDANGQDRGAEPWPASTSVPQQVSDGAAYAQQQLMEDVFDSFPSMDQGFDFPSPDPFNYNHHRPDG